MKLADWMAHTKDLEAFKATQEVRLAGVPQDPSGYQLEAPADLKLPDGMAIDLNPDLPEWKAAREFAHAQGMDQNGFNAMVKAYAGIKAQEAASYAEAMKAEMAKIGPNAPQVLDAVRASLVSHIGEGRARALALGVQSAEGLQGLQMLLSKLSSSGVQPPQPGGLPAQERSLAERLYPTMAKR